MLCPKVSVIAFNHFSPFHLSVPCIAFDSLLDNQRLFQLTFCAGEAGPLNSTLGLSINATDSLEVLSQSDIIVIPYWHDPAIKPDSRLLDALIDAHKRGSLLVGLCLGAYVLAYSGLLDNHRASTHWELQQDFTQRFPYIQLDTNALYVDDDRLITSAGTAAGLDCCLYIVRQFHGSSIANRLARRLVIPSYREGGQAQFIERPMPISTQDSRINNLLDHLRKTIQHEHRLDELANYVMMSRRTFTRLFRRTTGMSVGEWLTIERLQQSQHLLESTTLSIDRIAEVVGFASTAQLRQHFRQHFSVSPAQWRKNFSDKAIC